MGAMVVVIFDYFDPQTLLLCAQPPLPPPLAWKSTKLKSRSFLIPRPLSLSLSFSSSSSSSSYTPPPLLSLSLSLVISFFFSDRNRGGGGREGGGGCGGMMEGGENVDAAGTSSASCAGGEAIAAGAAVERGDSAAEESKNRSDGEEEETANGADDEEDADAAAEFVPGPLIPLKEQLEKDKDDESLRRWKEKLLGRIDENLNGQVEPEVVFQSIGIVSEGSGETTIPLPISEKHSNILFTLKEGSHYRLKLAFNVQHNIVSGLRYSNTVWRGGFRVDRSKGMLGTFAPQRDPYVYLLEDETTPSGVLARGVYSAKLKFEDDDKRCHMELNYCFEIKKQ